MPPLDRREIVIRAKEAFQKYGRGFLLMLDDHENPRYGSLPELEKRLGDDPDAKALIQSAVTALESYDPEREAVVIDSRPDGIFAMVVWKHGLRIVGKILFETTA
jgi:hypothetical protein